MLRQSINPNLNLNEEKSLKVETVRTPMQMISTKIRSFSEALVRVTSTWNSLRDTWIGELVAMMLSLCCSAAVIAVLLAFNNKPNPSMSLGITLNAVISVLATTSKAALLYIISNCLGQLKWILFTEKTPRTLSKAIVIDNASRGPLGALRLLVVGPRISLSSVGALLIIAAVALDPFVQQIITYNTQTRYLPSDTVVTSQAHLFAELEDHRYSADRVMAIFNGVGADLVSKQTSCPSGNCTFDSFQSLAWCSQCVEDENTTLSDGCSLVDRNGNNFADDIAFGDTQSRYCTLTSRSGEQTNVSVTTERMCCEGSESDSGMFLVQTSPYYQITENYWFNDTITATREKLDNWDPDFPLASWTFTELKVSNWSLALNSAHTCSVDLCVRNYSIGVDAGTTKTHILNSRYGYKTLHDENMNILERPPMQGDYYVCWSTEKMIAYDRFRDLPDGETPLPYKFDPENFAFCIPEGSPAWGWLQFVSRPIVGSKAASLSFYDRASDDRIRSGIDNRNSSFIITTNGGSNNGSVTFSFPDQDLGSFTQSIISAQRLGPQKFMQNIADTMTNVLLYQNATNVTGNLVTTVTVVEVRWIWLILPTTLLVGTNILLFFTIYSTIRSGTPVWKSSLAAPLFHGLVDANAGEQSGSLNTLSDMYKQAGATKPHLIPTNKSDRLVLETPTSTANEDHQSSPFWTRFQLNRSSSNRIFSKSLTNDNQKNRTIVSGMV